MTVYLEQNGVVGIHYLCVASPLFALPLEWIDHQLTARGCQRPHPVPVVVVAEGFKGMPPVASTGRCAPDGNPIRRSSASR